VAGDAAGHDLASDGRIGVGPGETRRVSTGPPRSPRSGFQARVEKRFTARSLTPIQAATAIAAVTLAVSIVAGIVVHWIDDSIPTIWLGIYWAVQTVTTVGYGDVTPRGKSGQAVSIALMLIGTAFIGIVTAAVTTTFIERARAMRAAVEEEGDDSERKALADVQQRLERIEKLLLDANRS
jgi:voltage-gated potassium channel